jgi:hypothetical protein
MVRRLLCLGAVLLVVGVGALGCDKAAKTNPQTSQPDPDKVAPPKPGGAKAG